MHSALGFSGYFSFVLHITLWFHSDGYLKHRKNFMKGQRVCQHLYHCKKWYLDAREVHWFPQNVQWSLLSPRSPVSRPFYFCQQHFLFVPLPPTRKCITDTDTIYLFIRKANEHVPDGPRGLQHVSCSHGDWMGLVWELILFKKSASLAELWVTVPG